MSKCAKGGKRIRTDETLVEKDGEDYHLDCEPLDDDEEETGDDLCDLCMSSEVHASRVTYCGKTIGIECGCDESNEDGKCSNEECEDCSKAA